MQSEARRRVPYSEHAIQTPRRVTPDWEAVRVSLEIVRKGSFRAAADHLQMTVNVLRRRVDNLEKSLGVKLLTRHVDGVRVTAEGERVFAAAIQMEIASFGLIQACEQSDSDDISGEVRLAVTEGLGTAWIAPRLVEFQRANPKLVVNLNCAMRSADVLRLEADVAIQISRPTAPDLRLVKLGRLHFLPFAAQSYLDTFGTPKTSADLVHHRILAQADDSTQWRDLYDRLFPGLAPASIIALRTNVSSAHYWSIAKGAGIGLLPTYAQWIGSPIVPLDLGIHETVDIWLTYHPDVKRIPRISRLIDWSIEAFSPQKYPWFRDEFIHSNELKSVYRHEPLTNMFTDSTAA